MLCACFVGVEFKCTDVMYLCRMVIYFIFILFLFLEPYVGTDVMVLRLLYFFYLFLFIISSWMEYRTLSQICGMLYLPIFLFRVGLLTFIYIASFMALAILCPSLPVAL